MSAVLVDSVRTYARSMPHRLAVGCTETGRRWSWAELDAAIDRAAAWLVGKLGAASGSRALNSSRLGPLSVRRLSLGLPAAGGWVCLTLSDGLIEGLAEPVRTGPPCRTSSLYLSE